VSESQDDRAPADAAPPEPAFNAPAISLVLVLALATAYGVQVLLLSPQAVSALALSAPALADGRWWTLISHVFLHGGLVHLLMNIGAALAFGPAVARYFGRGARSAGVFILYFLVCGVAGGMGFLALNPDSAAQVIGASGAISGLWGGAARLVGRRRGLWGLWQGPAPGQIIAVVALNLLIAVTGFAAGGLQIAWQAHIAGFVAGLLLIGPFGALARPSDRDRR